MPNNVAVEFTVGQRNSVEAEYTVEQSQAIDTEFTIDIRPTKVSQLENDLEYQTKDEVDTALEGKQDTLIEGTGISIVDNIISATGAQAVWGLITGDINDQTDLKNALDSKQDVISDLSEIRSGAALGATAVQSVTEGTANGTIKVDGNSVSVHGLGSAAYTASTAYDASGSASTAETNAKNYADGLASNYATAAQGALADTAVQPADLATVATSGLYSDLSGTPSLATVATSGSYNDLLNKPTIPDTTYMVTTNTAQTISANKTFHNAELSTDNMITLNGSTSFLRGLKGIEYRNLIKLNSSGITAGSINEVLTLNGSGTRPKYNSSDVALYSDIPTVNDGKLALQVNSTDIGEFTANQSSDTTINISVPTDTGDLTNGAGFITNSALSGYLQNNGTGTNALAVGDSSQSTAEGGVAVGDGARANSTYSVAVGQDTRATNTNTTVIGRAAKATQARAIAIGSGAEANAQDAIALKGINNTANTFQVYTYPMLDMSNGLIPDARISTNIARSADIPAAQVNSDWNANSGVAQILNKPSLATVATSGAYSDLTGTPTIPTVNNATLTITQGGVSKGTFTANASSDVTIDLDAGGGGGSYTEGTGIDITSGVISVTSPTLTNNTTHGLSILGTTSNTNTTTSIGKYASATGIGSIAISDCYGVASASGTYATCVGGDSSATGTAATAFGSHAKATANYAIQLGYGTNSEANSFYVSTSTSNNWKMLGSDGKIPAARLPIATSVSSSSTNDESVGAKVFYDTCGDIETLINAL